MSLPWGGRVLPSALTGTLGTCSGLVSASARARTAARTAATQKAAFNSTTFQLVYEALGQLGRLRASGQGQGAESRSALLAIDSIFTPQRRRIKVRQVLQCSSAALGPWGVG
jgi:hypothetical protein